ncbi:MarR family winged helix-turn-helix transcriptional regulator [Paraburkholderia pallida]|uniref:MarR family transcriptional regulator n=1 Tax=Paraburkholderia pallida TaxID=2547399 RepID=A0A4P7D101_9BURK|nr:MarR family winged helix-turn-helix transcriptional regulator [Paraburkholderia pallida]QBR00084.1 MarR family transcriptional regulator [Paraburkholderia pallida]
MRKTKRTPAGTLLSEMILDLFRLNNRLLSAADRLVAELGLTSARWQILGTIATARQPQPVAWLARDVGAHRQNVQRIVNELAEEGIVAFEPNPHHRRAALVVLTDKGLRAFEDAMRLQVPWVNNLADGLQVEDLDATQKVITEVLRKLEGDGE